MAGLDVVTYLRTEWVSAALCTNQTPRAADVCLQLGTQDGRAVLFVPRTIREFVTSSVEKDGTISPTIRRQLKQQAERRSSAVIRDIDQRADDLKEMDDESVDVVISLQSAAVMKENGLDWQKSIREAARVLKPGGRLLFVEQTEIDGESYLDYIMSLNTVEDKETNTDGDEDDEDDDDDDDELIPIFDDVGYDDVDLVITPHIAGVAIKSLDAGMTASEAEAQRLAEAKRAEEQKMAEFALQAFEGGLKKKRRRKKKQQTTTTEEQAKA
jgi:SAM-dependent methyltransferase